MKTLVAEHIKDSNKDSHFILRIVIMAVSAALFAFCMASLVLNVDVRRLDYHESGNVDYSVCLIANNYFNDECQPAGKQYVASLINSVDAEFEYNFRADENLEYAYEYDITAKLVATESGDSDKVLYENDEVILPSQKFDGQTGQNFAVREKVSIDYGKYNNLITAFRSDYGLTINANVTVAMNVKIQGQPAQFVHPLQVRQAVALKIPLSERTINVEIKSDQLTNDGALEETAPNFAKNFLFVILGLVAGVVFGIDSVTSVIILIRREAKRSVYEKELGRIMHEYSQLIVEVEHVPEIPRNKVIQVKNFDELLDARDTIQQPILHLEVGESRDMFIIEDQGMAYVYVLSAKSTTRKL
jgi:hypothetical protein